MVALFSETDDRVFKAIADPTRRAILDDLRGGERRATDIAAAFREVSRQSIAKHLKVLDEAGLVDVSASGRERRYRVQAEPLRRIDAWLDGYRTSLARRLVDLKAHAENEQRDEKGTTP